METLPNLAQDVLSISGAVTVLLSFSWAVARLTISKQIIPALKEHKDEFKAWNSELYKEEIEQSSNAAESVERIQETLNRLSDEMKSVRISMTKHDETLIALPGILTHLNITLELHRKTDGQLGDVLTQLGKDVNETKINVAHIMGKLSMESRRTPEAVLQSNK